jgi:hypothetical protein
MSDMMRICNRAAEIVPPKLIHVVDVNVEWNRQLKRFDKPCTAFSTRVDCFFDVVFFRKIIEDSGCEAQRVLYQIRLKLASCRIYSARLSNLFTSTFISSFSASLHAPRVERIRSVYRIYSAFYIFPPDTFYKSYCNSIILSDTCSI